MENNKNTIDPKDLRWDAVPLLGNFFTDDFSHAVRVTHIPTGIVVYRSPFDFPEPKLREELQKIALEEMENKVQKRLASHL